MFAHILRGNAVVNGRQQLQAERKASGLKRVVMNVWPVNGHSKARRNARARELRRCGRPFLKRATKACYVDDGMACPTFPPPPDAAHLAVVFAIWPRLTVFREMVQLPTRQTWRLDAGPMFQRLLRLIIKEKNKESFDFQVESARSEIAFRGNSTT